MSWSNNATLVLTIIAACVIAAGGAAGIAIFVQIVRQRGLKLAEPSVIKARWQMVRIWLLVGVGFGLLFGIALVSLSRTESTPPAAPKDIITSQPTETKSRPREGGQPTE